MKIKVTEGKLKDREFIVDAEHVDEDKGITICGRSYCVYLPKDNYEILEADHEEDKKESVKNNG
jgi:hypothetical protein